MLAGVLLWWAAPDVPPPPERQRYGQRYGWTAPAECPTSADLQAAVEHYVDRPLDRPGDRAIGATAKVERASTGPRFRLNLRIEAQQSEPVDFVLEDDDCRVLSSAAALMIAVALDPKAAARASQTPPLAPPEPPVVPPPEPATPAPAPVTVHARPLRHCGAGKSALRRAPRDLRPCVSLTARVGLQFGVLPEDPGFGVGGDLSLLWPRLRVELGGRHWFAGTARLEDGRGADIALSTGSIAACGRLDWRKFEFPLCAGLEIGSLYGKGTGVDTPQSDHLLWIAGWLGPRIAWIPVRRLELFTAVDLLLPTARYRFVLDEVGEVHHVSPVAGRLSWGISLRL